MSPALSPALRPAPLVDQFVAGMPQLCYNGLSENWLLKECGHRHWLTIAQQQGQAQPEFRDATGHKVYAAFTLVRIHAARLDQVGENDAFALSSQGCPAGRAQHYSRHSLAVHGQQAGTVEMLSAFVRRAQAGNNRSVVRAAMADTPPAAHEPALAAAAQDFAQRGRQHRAQAADPGPAAASKRFDTLYTPCPNNDFNGADLLYFASFQALVDRAEWAWMLHTQPPGRPATLLERELVFYGNLNLGDGVRTGLVPQACGNGQLAHHSRLCRDSDGSRIADVFTRKLAPRRLD